MTTKKHNEIHIYVDGARPGVPGVGPGGWGVLICIAGQEECLFGGENDTTNNRMELMAAIKAIDALPVPCDLPIVIYSDSQYVIKGITSWIKNWKIRNWRNIKNSDLWEKLDYVTSRHPNIEWKWVKGHSGIYGNEKADRLATAGALSLDQKKLNKNCS